MIPELTHEKSLEECLAYSNCQVSVPKEEKIAQNSSEYNHYYPLVFCHVHKQFMYSKYLRIFDGILLLFS